MKRILLTAFTIISLAFFSACSSNSSNDYSTCQDTAQIVSDPAFDLINTSNYEITSVTLNEDCLDITVSSSGCSANNWTMSLFGATTVTPNTSQRSVKVELTNNEVCLAILPKTVSFDLTPYRIQGQHIALLNLAGWDQQIIYTY